MTKKLAIKVTFSCGKVSTIDCNSRKQLKSELKRLSKGNPIWDGNKYTDKYTIAKF